MSSTTNTYWFHRNAMKYTNEQEFLVPELCNASECAKVLSDLKQSRMALVKGLNDVRVSREQINEMYQNYARHLKGLTEAPDRSPSPEVVEPEKLGPINSVTRQKQQTDKTKQCAVSVRHVFAFRWSDSLSIKPKTETIDRVDAVNDLIGATIAYGICLMKIASRKAANDGARELTEADALEILNCLKEAGGVFKYAKDEIVGYLAEPFSIKDRAYSDVDTRVLDAYYLQCKGELLEVVVARALIKNMKKELTAGLCNSCRDFYRQAYDALMSNNHKEEYPAKWILYLELKEKFYTAMAHAYYGLSLLPETISVKNEAKSGLAIGHLRYAEAILKNTDKIGKDYVKTVGAGTLAKPHKHPFYDKICAQIRIAKDKAETENNNLYYQKVVDPGKNGENLQPEFKDCSELAKVKDFVMPEKNPIFTDKLYGEFHATRVVPTNLFQKLTLKRSQKAAADVTQDYNKDSSDFKKVPIIVHPEPDLKITRGSECIIS